MNKKGGRADQTASAWRLEVKRFKELYNKWLDYRLNKFFDLSVHGPPYRSKRINSLRVGFVLVVFIAYLLSYSFLAQVYSQQTTLSSLLIVAGLNVIRLLLILSIPVFIAIEMAGNYITDIFELEDPSVAWKFIGEISLGGASEVLHIRDGKVAEEDRDSPIVLIGGPGHVQVEFDTAVLFEKPDGTPHVIGPVVTKSEEKIRQFWKGLNACGNPSSTCGINILAIIPPTRSRSKAAAWMGSRSAQKTSASYLVFIAVTALIHKSQAKKNPFSTIRKVFRI